MARRPMTGFISAASRGSEMNLSPPRSNVRIVDQRIFFDSTTFL